MADNILQFAQGDGLFRMKWEYERERTGYEDLLDFGTADMDFRSAQPILNELAAVVQRGHLGYPMRPAAYYDAIHHWLIRRAQWDVDVYTCMEQNVGIYPAVFNALDALTLPGDKIAIFTPVHFCFKHIIQINNRIALECPLEEQDGIYQINFTALESCLQSGAKVLWICNPHNPVGRAWSRSDLQAIADLCIKYNVTIFSDDVYCDLLYDGAVYTPIASLSQEISQRTITFYSPSKAYNLTGLRHSFTVTENPEFMKCYRESMSKVDLDYGMSIMGIAATIAAYSHCDDWLHALMSQVSENHSSLVSYCREFLPEVTVARANATYFAWLDLRAFKLPPAQLSYLLEQEEHLIVSNGLQLGKGGGGFIRMNIATSEETLRKGMERLGHFRCVHRK